MGVAALVLGIIGLVLSIIPVIGILGAILGVIGLILGIVEIVNKKKKEEKYGKALAGVICSGIAIVIVILYCMLFGFLAVRVARNVDEDSVRDFIDDVKEYQHELEDRGYEFPDENFDFSKDGFNFSFSLGEPADL